MRIHYKEINFLRVFFMLMIFFHHFNYDYMGGDCAVAAFFIISGFCLTLGYADVVVSNDFSWESFMKKRVIKLYPVHIIALILTWIGFDCIVPHNLWGWFKLFANLTLIQSWIPERSIFFSYNAPSWYLCDLIFFTAVFPMLYKCIIRLSKKTIILISVVITIIYILLVNILNEEQLLTFLYINPISRLVDCVIGMALAMFTRRIAYNEIYRNWIDQRTRIVGILFWIILTIVLFLSIKPLFFDCIYTATFWPSLFLLVFSMALLGLVRKETITKKIINNKVFVLLGGCSLSFYLLHIPIINFIHHINDNWYADCRNISGALVCLVVTIIFSFISKEYVETKLIERFKRMLNN